MFGLLFEVVARFFATGSTEAASRFSEHSDRDREDEFQHWADQHGLTSEAKNDDVPRDPYGHFAVFTSDGTQKRLLTVKGEVEFIFGGRPHACAVLLGDVVSSADLQMESGNPAIFQLIEHASEFRFSYLLLRLPFDNLPALRIRHRHCPGATGVMVGREMQKFEWNEFNRNVQVACDDKRFGSDLVCKRMMDYLHECPAWPIAINGGWLSMTDFQSQWTVEETGNTLNWLHEFFATWPEHLVDTLLRKQGATSSIGRHGTHSPHTG
jgi:hypothetical protein